MPDNSDLMAETVTDRCPHCGNRLDTPGERASICCIPCALFPPRDDVSPVSEAEFQRILRKGFIAGREYEFNQRAVAGDDGGIPYRELVRHEQEDDARASLVTVTCESCGSRWQFDTPPDRLIDCDGCRV